MSIPHVRGRTIERPVTIQQINHPDRFIAKSD
jgi:hypothetical protein